MISAMPGGNGASPSRSAPVEHDLRAMGERVDALLRELQACANPVQAGAKAEELVSTLVKLYGEGLSRILAIVDEHAGEAGQRVFDRLCADDFVASLLILHDLHPLGTEERIEKALASVRTYLHSHEGDVELLRVEEGVAYLRMAGSCNGCPSSAETMKLAIEKAVYAAAPEVTAIRAEGVRDRASVQRKASDWVSLDGFPQLESSGIAPAEVQGTPVLFLRMGDTLYAYRNQCPRCLSGLSGAALDWPLLACRSCGQEYDVVKAGRAPQADVYLEPFPLVRDAGRVQLAIPVTV